MEKWNSYRDNIRKKIEQVQGTILIEDQENDKVFPSC